ncbi:anti-sigma-F factor Fin family protein [Evansella sp. LMS18]|uniref:anti-sigma-F factor Fin family protein n=1 Tax=Evansella TaxID=2837485 RepID=UPI000B44438F|nr:MULTISPECIES: anti-sigma-F factor Fin family protein [Evansella]UTR12446.1 anti-sigma-F factor Fin family protein [Evansella sp. LMS18]
MSVHYYCRHCQANLGTLSSWQADEQQLGFNRLSDEERKDMINYDSQGHLHVKVICEACETTLKDYPDYHANESFIH